jgi:hypothetical protein
VARPLRALLLILLFAWGHAYCLQADDAFAMAEALIRHDLTIQHTYLSENAKDFRFFASVQGIDFPDVLIGRLRDTGLAFLPGSTWKAPGSGTTVGNDMRMTIGEPTRRSVGTFEVIYSFYCGTRCASGNTAIMRRDASGWHVVESRLDRIS